MELTLDRAADAAERHPCPKCEAPAGSACRTRSGKVAAKYHTARFILVPALREELGVAVPADRGPGTPWKRGRTCNGTVSYVKAVRRGQAGVLRGAAGGG